MQLKSFTDAVDENHMLRSTLGDIVAHILILNTHTSYIYIENRNYKVYLLIHNLRAMKTALILNTSTKVTTVN